MPDEAEPVEDVVAAKPAKKPKRKKRRHPRERSEQTTPTWILWLVSVGGFALLAGLIVLPAIYKGYGALVLLYSVIMAVMIPISTVILIVSMFISSWLGGGCSTENDEDDGPIVSVTLAGTQATDADLARLKSFPKLRSLNLSGTPITDAGLVHLKKLNQLVTLTLTGTRVTNAGVADLQAALPRVKIVR